MVCDAPSLNVRVESLTRDYVGPPRHEKQWLIRFVDVIFDSKQFHRITSFKHFKSSNKDFTTTENFKNPNVHHPLRQDAPTGCSNNLDRFPPFQTHKIYSNRNCCINVIVTKCSFPNTRKFEVADRKGPKNHPESRLSA